MKKIGIVLGVIVAVILILAFTVPHFFDLNAYKPFIAQKAKEATGRDLVIDGNISLSLLPVPGATIEKVRFGNVPGGSAQAMAAAETVKIRVALLPLLSRRVEVESIILEQPTVILEKLPDGTGNWQIAPVKGASTAATGTPEQAKQETGAFAVSVNRASITDGTVIYRDLAAKSEQKITHIDLDLSLDSLRGPFSLKGALQAMDLPLAVAAKIGNLDQPGGAPVAATLALSDKATTVDFIGTVDSAAADDKPMLNGKLTLKGANAAKLATALPAWAFALEGDVLAGKRAAAVKNLVATFGDATAKGGIEATYGATTEIKAQLAAQEINIDTLLPAGGKADATSAKEKKAEGQGGGFTLPENVNASLDLAVGRLLYQGKSLDKVKLLGVLRDGELRLQELSARLPGNGAFLLSGQVAPHDGQPQFSGALQAKADDLHPLIAMFAPGSVDGVPAERLRNFTLTSGVKARAAELTLSSLAAGIDQTRLTGGLSMALPDHVKRQRPAFGLGLALDNLDLDSYRPAAGTKPRPAGGAPAKGGSPLAMLRDLDANVDLRAGSLTVNGQRVEGLHADAGLDSGAFAIRDLSAVRFLGGPLAVRGSAKSGADDLSYDLSLQADGVGGRGKLVGKIAGLSGAPAVDTSINLTFDRPGALLRFAGLEKAKADMPGPLSVNGTLKGDAQKMMLDLGLQALGGKGQVSGAFNMAAKPAAFDLTVAADHPDFANLLKETGLPGVGKEAGPLRLALKASGTAAAATLDPFSAQWGDSRLDGKVSYDATAARPRLTAAFTGGTVNIAPFMGGGDKAAKQTQAAGGKEKGGEHWSQVPFDFAALDKQDATVDFKAKSLIMPDRRIDDLVLALSLTDGLLRLQTLTGKIYGGSFDLSGTSLNARGTPALDMHAALAKIEAGQLAGGGIAGSQIKGPLSVNLQAKGSGESELAMVRSLAGAGDLNGRIMIIGKLEQTVGSALLAVLGEKVKQVKGVANTINGVLASFTGVDNELSGTFKINGGVLETDDTAFRNPKARGTAKGKIDLGAWVMHMLLDLFDAQSNASFMSVNLDGPLDSPKPTFSTTGAAGPSGLGDALGLQNLLGGQGTGLPLPNLPLPGGLTLPGQTAPQPAPAPGTTAPGAVQSPETTAPLLPGIGDLLGIGKKKKTPATQPEPGSTAP